MLNPLDKNKSGRKIINALLWFCESFFSSVEVEIFYFFLQEEMWWNQDARVAARWLCFGWKVLKMHDKFAKTYKAKDLPIICQRVRVKVNQIFPKTISFITFLWGTHHLWSKSHSFNKIGTSLVVVKYLKIVFKMFTNLYYFIRIFFYVKNSSQQFTWLNNFYKVCFVTHPQLIKSLLSV